VGQTEQIRTNTYNDSTQARTNGYSDSTGDSVIDSLFNFDRAESQYSQDIITPATRLRNLSLHEGDEFPDRRGTERLTDTNIASEIIELYNEAVTDALARERFREMCKPIRVGTVNAVERRQNPTLKAEYKETTDGDFFAFAIPGKNEYAVVPRLGLTIEAVSYNAGALGEVFSKTQGHDPKRFYTHYRVRHPATFKRDGEHWELLSSGELDLGEGD
jgi:hypothetical protein